jgi:hypothetical protein
VWNKSGLGKPGNGKGNVTAPIGLVLLLTGFLLLTTPLWASPEHVVDGINYVLVLAVPLVVNGAAMMMGGAGMLFLPRWISRWLAVGSER